MKKLIYSAIIFRILTQFSCEFISNDIAQGLVYAIGVAYFEIVALWVFTRILNKDDYLVNFALGLCAFDLFKFLFLNPFNVTKTEYLNVLIGVLFMIYIKYINKPKEPQYKGKL